MSVARKEKGSLKVWSKIISSENNLNKMFKAFKEKMCIPPDVDIEQFKEIITDLVNHYKGVIIAREKYSSKRWPYLKWRLKKCELCGYNKYEGSLCVHHLNKKLKNTKRDNKNNVITLCLNCHRECEQTHTYPKWKNRKTFLKWKEKIKKN